VKSSRSVGACAPASSSLAAGIKLLASDSIIPPEILPLRLKTVARLTDVSEKTVRRWISAGLLLSHKLGGARVVRQCDLRTFLDQQAGTSNNAAA
jgi:excisionase family DNA binding protein